MHKTIKIGGMTCPHCSARVETALNALNGVTARVDTAAKSAQIDTIEPISDATLIKTIQDAGYKVLGIES